MSRPIKIFISYKTGEDDGLTFTAHTIRKFLADAGYEVFMDQTNLKAGEPWDKQIYEAIPQSDMLLLLIAGKTADSHWVNREVDFAKGSRVTILPVLARSDFDIKAVLERFDISTLQYVRLLTGTDAEFANLKQAVEEIKDRTRATQRKWLEDLIEWRKSRPYPEPNKSLDVYTMPDLPQVKCEIHLAAGNMFAMNDIDVFVNTENSYMQMARTFDQTRTVSAMLRYYGSKLDKADRIIEDTIQDEIDAIIAHENEIRTRPVGIGTVIVTSAGYEGSDLRQNRKARYVFHTAAVSVIGEGPTKSLECVLNQDGIKRCVRKTLEKTLEVNQNKGVVSPPGKLRTEQEAAAAKYKPLKSIIIPVFGAGHGGRPADEIIPALVKGVKEFLVDRGEDPNFSLERIHLSAYLEEDVEFMRQALADHFSKA